MASVWQALRDRSVVLMMVAALASCGPRPGEEGSADPDDDAVGTHSALGGYLAGRLAQAHGDTKAAADYYAVALEHDPDNAELMQRTFSLMVAEGKVDAAVPLAERLAALDSDSPLPLMVLGSRDARDGRFAEAEKRFARLPKKGVNVFLSPLAVAWARAGQGKTDSALEALAPLTHTNGLKPLQGFHAGLINDLADRTKVAEENYQAAIAAGQLNIRSVEALGSLFQRTDRMDQAREIYNLYKNEHPETLLFSGDALLKAGAQAPRPVADAKSGLSEAYFDVATLMRQGNAPDLAMVFARLALVMQPNFPLVQMSVGDLLSAQGRTDEANAIYRAIDPASPVHAFGRLRIAMNLDDSGKTDDALDELDRLARDLPDNLDALVAKGDTLRKHKRFGEAAGAYTTAFTRIHHEVPEYWALYYSRGISYERAHQWPKAEADFLKALQLKPDEADVLNYLGYSWVDQGVNLERGRQMIEKAVQLRPKDGAIVDSLGWALYRMNDFHGAVKQLERAVELKPEDPTINEHLGDAYWQVGRIDEARFQWQRAMGLDPEPEQIDPLKEKIATGELPAVPAKK